MTKQANKVQKLAFLPAQEYYTELNKKGRSTLILELMPMTGKGKTTLWRWFHGKTRPDKANREKIAFSLSKIVNAELNEDKLFPDDYPYTGANKK